MKTVPQLHSVHGPRLHSSLRLWGRREPPLCYDVMHACGNQPHACRPRHTRLPMPRHARESWEAQRAKNLTAVKTAPPTRAPFLGLAQQRIALMCGLGRGLLSVYKKRGAFLYPYTCARAVGAAPTVTPSRTGEVSQGKTKAQDNKSNAKAKTTKSRGTK